MTAAGVLERGGSRPFGYRSVQADRDGAVVAPAAPALGATVRPDGKPSTDPVSLESLVASAVADVPGARDRLLTQIHPFVLRYCRGRLGRQESVSASAEDVAQEVCLAVVSALPSYTVKGLSFRAFVYGIAAHKVTDTFRAIGRNRADPVAELPDTPGPDAGPEFRVLACERDERLGELLRLLTPRQREVLVLRIAVGLSAEETAAAVRSTPGAVRVTQHRALHRLRDVVGRSADTLGLLGLVAPEVAEPVVEAS